MSKPIRWTSVSIVAWRPVLTFERRRLELLDWYEQNTDVYAFTDAPDHLGIAVTNEFQRLRLDRTNLRLELRSPHADLDLLEGALSRTLSEFGEEEPEPTAYVGVWSVPLEGSYEDLRGRLVRRSLGPDWSDDTGVPDDCAYLVDLTTEVGALKVEFGIVSDTELVHRLQTPSSGRLSSLVGLARPAATPELEDLPAASLYVEAFCQPTGAGPVTDFAQMSHLVTGLETSLGQVVRSLAETL